MTTINIILVHGAWADGSCWSRIIPALDAAGLQVTAVQLPLTTFKDDVATVRRALALANGPALLVGHSYGGAVITEAGTDNKVAGLVYVAAFGPDAGESAGALLASMPPTPLASEFRPDDEGFLKLTRKGYFESFAQDLTEQEKIVLFATHAPTNGQSLGGIVTDPAWKAKPSSCIVAANDRAIDPALESRMAERMKARTVTLQTSHLAMLAAPDAVGQFIIEAARS